MDFCTALTIIFANSNVTTQGMANYIGYDASYISKWKSGKSAPSPKSYDTVIRKMCEYIFLECGDRNISRIFSALHERAPEGNENRMFALQKFLENCLLKQAVNTGASEEQAISASEGVICPVASFNKQMLGQYLSSTNVETCREKSVIMAVEPCIFNDFFASFWGDLLFDNQNCYNKKLQILWVNKGKKFDLNLFKMIVRIMNNNNYDDMSFLEAARHRLYNTFVVKNQYLLTVNPDLDSDLGSVVLSSDASLNERTYSALRAYGRANYNSIIRIPHEVYLRDRSDLEMVIHGFVRQISSVMTTLYMDDEVLERFRTECGISEEYIALQHKVNRNKKTVLMYKSAIANYAHNGVMTLDYKLTNVPPELRKLHLNGLLKKIDDGDTLRLILLDDKNPVIPSGRNLITLRGSANSFSAIQRAATPEDSKIYFFSSKDMVLSFITTFDTLLEDCSVFKKYCMEGTEAKQYIQALINSIG